MKPWVEKYRPTTLKNIIGQDKIIRILKNSVENKTPITHLLFYGPPGTGKTTTILSYCYDMFGDKYKNFILELNASKESGISVVKTTILNFAKRKVYNNDFKIVILDEADAMTEDAQTALRKIMENYDNTKFCIICNYPEKIIPAICSRCMEFEFKPLNKDNVKVHLTNIYNKEFTNNNNIIKNVKDIKNDKVRDNIINNILMLCDGDLRKGINMLQNYKYNIDVLKDGNYEDIFYDLEGMISEDKLDDIVEKIRNIKDGNELIDVYNEININNYSIKNIIKQIINIYELDIDLSYLINNDVSDEIILFKLISEIMKV